MIYRFHIRQTYSALLKVLIFQFFKFANLEHPEIDITLIKSFIIFFFKQHTKCRIRRKLSTKNCKKIGKSFRREWLKQENQEIMLQEESTRLFIRKLYYFFLN